MIPVETLRAAAAKVRKTASRATPGPWEDTPDALWIGGQVWGYRILKDGNLAVGDRGCPDAEWIALASPAIAPVIVAWLEGAAGDVEAALDAYRGAAASGHLLEFVDEPDSVRHALALAALITGQDPA